MSDDLAFGAFPFDFDFTDSFPVGDFAVTNDPGWPRVWTNIDDIIGGPLDLIGKIGELFKEQWDSIWSGIGGGLRWVYDKLGWGLIWVWQQVEHWGGVARDAAWDAGGWVWKQAEHWGGVARDAAWDAGGWVWRQVEHWGGAARDAAWDAGGWVWRQVEHWGGVARDAAWDAGGWVGGQVEHWGGVARDAAWDAGGWVWKQVEHWGGVARDAAWDAGDFVVENVGDAVDSAASSIVGGITGGFDRLGDILGPPFEFLGDRIANAIKWPFETLFEPLIDLLDQKLAIPGKLLHGEYSTLQEFHDDLMDPPDLLGFPKFFGFVAVGILATILSLLPTMRPVVDEMVQLANAEYTPRLLGEGEILDAELREIPVRYGYGAQLERWGYHDENIAALRALRQQIPGSGDLVRFAVREAFDRTKAEALGFITDLPGDFALWMQRQGFGEEWSERFWWAHWDLPSVGQGFEMLHRDVIDRDALEGLLIALDIPPKWIPRLLDISYSVITRVDIRRMYQDGIVDEDEVERTYRHRGYSPEDARKITDMVKIRYARGGKGEGTDLRELTLSTIKQAYVRRLIDPGEALERLQAMDFPEEDAELILSIWDFDLAQNPDQRSDIGLRELTASVIERAYEHRLFDFNRALVELIELGFTQEDAEIKLHLVDFRMAEDLTELQIDGALNDLEAGLISEAQVEGRLGEFGLPEERIDYLLQRELLRRQVKTRRLTVSQLQRARAAGHITTDEELLDRITTLGYNERDASILVKMV